VVAVSLSKLRIAVCYTARVNDLATQLMSCQEIPRCIDGVARKESCTA
jgi:hypothetical protein